MIASWLLNHIHILSGTIFFVLTIGFGYLAFKSSDDRVGYGGMAIAMFALIPTSFSNHLASQATQDILAREMSLKKYVRWRAMTASPEVGDFSIIAGKRPQTLSMACYDIDVFPIYVDLASNTATDYLDYEKPPLTIECNFDVLDLAESSTGSLKIAVEDVEAKLAPSIVPFLSSDAPQSSSGNLRLDGVYIQLHYWHDESDEHQVRVEGRVPILGGQSSTPVELSECGWVERDAHPHRAPCEKRLQGLDF